jgi:hypothetical protein
MPIGTDKIKDKTHSGIDTKDVCDQYAYFLTTLVYSWYRFLNEFYLLSYLSQLAYNIIKTKSDFTHSNYFQSVAIFSIILN